MGKPFVIIELDKPRKLRYGMNALITIEEMTGQTISKIDFENLSMKDMRNIIYAGLAHEDKDLTPEKVGELIDEYSDLETVANKVAEAFTEAYGKND